MSKSSSVYVAKIDADPKDAVLWVVSRTSLPKEAKRIVVKPNLNEYRKPETASTADPVIVDALLSVLRSRYRDSEIIMIENDATGVNADNIFRFVGLDRVAAKHGCRTFNVAHDKWVLKSIRGTHFTKVHIPQILDTCDLFITHPKLKTHGKTKISCGLKNQFGLLRPKNKMPFHDYLDEAIVDINLARKPDLSIVDANICMEGNEGPSYGSPKKLGLIVGGNDIVAVDAFCANLAGFRPYLIGHIRRSAGRGLGRRRFRALWNGTPLDRRITKFKFNWILHRALEFARGGVR